ASERRPGSDDLEEARADSRRTYCSRGARARERELPEAAALVHRHALERLRIPLPAVELAGGELEESTVRARRPGEDPHQAFRLLERQRTQQDGVHDAEDRGVVADAKRQYTADHTGDAFPALGFTGQLFAAGLGDRIELRLAVAFRGTPFRTNPALLRQAQQGVVDGAFVEAQAIVADLLDASRDSIPVQRPQRIECLEHHQI